MTFSFAIPSPVAFAANAETRCSERVPPRFYCATSKSDESFHNTAGITQNSGANARDAEKYSPLIAARERERETPGAYFPRDFSPASGYSRRSSHRRSLPYAALSMSRLSRVIPGNAGDRGGLSRNY